MYLLYVRVQQIQTNYFNTVVQLNRTLTTVILVMKLLRYNFNMHSITIIEVYYIQYLYLLYTFIQTTYCSAYFNYVVDLERVGQNKSKGTSVGGGGGKRPVKYFILSVVFLHKFFNNNTSLLL